MQNSDITATEIALVEMLDPVAEVTGVPSWILTAFLVVLGSLLLEFAYRQFSRQLQKCADRSDRLWDDALVRAGKAPVSLLIWWQGVVLAARLIAPETEMLLFDPALLATLQQLGLILAATWFLFRLVSGFEQAFIRDRQRRDLHVDLTTVNALARIMRIAVVITGVLTVLSILDISIAGLLAAGGVGGIAVGLAARDLLANFFGGFMVFMDRPFSVGDWVRSPDRDIEGVVEKIGWRMTTIRKFDRRPMYVPNATFTTITVENPSRMSHRRLFEVIGVRYDDQHRVAAIVTDIRQMLMEHEDIASEETLMVHFDEYAASSLDIMVYCFTHTVQWMEFHRVKEDVLLRIGGIIEGHGASIAFPTRTLKLETAEQLALEHGEHGA